MNGGIGCIKENIVQTKKTSFFLPVKKSYKSIYIVLYTEAPGVSLHTTHAFTQQNQNFFKK